MTLWSPQLATVHVPAVPAVGRKFRAREDSQQPVGGIRDQHFAGNPVPDSAWRDVQHLRSGFGSETQISEHDFQARREDFAGLACLGRLSPALLVLYTMYIMFSLSTLRIALISESKMQPLAH